MHLAFGANVVEGGVAFRVWAPNAERVEVEGGAGQVQTWSRLEPAGGGVFAGQIAGLGPGARYRYRLDGKTSYPDPWSRSQPEGVHGPSEVVDPMAFTWTDAGWPGLERDRLAIYELHVGTFTAEGTFVAVAGQLDALRRLGITAIELMPVAEFPGRWNWGYDGVDLFAPSHVYGGPVGLRRLVDAAHRHGLGVLLDVVYNHLGPDGNYLRAFSDDYFTDRHHTPWGDSVNFDGRNHQRVRELVVENARYWLREFHLDGLRLDATHEIVDDSPRHILQEIADAARHSGDPNGTPRRPPIIIAEDERNDVRLVRPVAQNGYGLDALWADDFHHAAHVYLTGEREGYYRDYAGTSDEIARVISSGFLYQGQRSANKGRPRGTKVKAEPASAFVFCLQNHDQVGNRAFGERLNHLIDPAAYAVASGLLLLSPETPLLFMGQEFAASAPFQYFTDHTPELGRLVTAGRRAEFARFSAFADPTRRDQIPDPQSESTFRRSTLDLAERQSHAAVLALYRELLRLRRNDPVFASPSRERTTAEALGDDCVVVRRWSADAPGERRIVVANFGAALDVAPLDHPSLAWLAEGPWRSLLSTAARRFGAEHGARAGLLGGRLRIPARTLVVLAPRLSSSQTRTSRAH